jgi:hypothetical protein
MLVSVSHCSTRKFERKTGNAQNDWPGSAAAALGRLGGYGADLLQGPLLQRVQMLSEVLEAGLLTELPKT